MVGPPNDSWDFFFIDSTLRAFSAVINKHAYACSRLLCEWS